MSDPLTEEEFADALRRIQANEQQRKQERRDRDRRAAEHLASLELTYPLTHYDCDPRNPSGSQFEFVFGANGLAGIGTRDHDWCPFDPSPQLAERLIVWLQARLEETS